jgi:alpha-acetolactate decarboxylase
MQMISQDYSKLNIFKKKVTNIQSDIEKLMNSGNIFRIIEIDDDFENMSSQLNNFSYLNELNEGVLYKNYGAALRDNINTSPYEGFTQACHDCFFRLKFRTMSESA